METTPIRVGPKVTIVRKDRFRCAGVNLKIVKVLSLTKHVGRSARAPKSARRNDFNRHVAGDWGNKTFENKCRKSSFFLS